MNGEWQPTIARVSGNYARGGLGSLNELVHENGHVVHMMALRTRPAFMDLGDAVFYEAFADVPSWSTYEPAWQQKYLGRARVESGVAAWRCIRTSCSTSPGRCSSCACCAIRTRDPNVVWTEITQPLSARRAASGAVMVGGARAAGR